MKAGIITIGDEILVGQTIDTNSAFIAKELRKIGASITEIRSIADKEKAIIESIEDLKCSVDVIFITGGLGPTNDDITKRVLCKYFNDELERNVVVEERISDYFKSINREMKPSHYRQADLPKNAEIILNDMGTASGMWFRNNEIQVISMPGVPYEMKGLILKALPILQEEFNIGDFYHRTLLFQGLGETTIADKIQDIEDNAKKKEISLAYLPSVGQVKVRFTGSENQKELIDEFIKTTKDRFPFHLFGEENDSLEGKIGELLNLAKATVGTVESCTSGNLAARIVSVPGASSYFEGSLLTYSYRLKSELLGIPQELISNKGAVSQEVVEAMAKLGRERLNVDYCLSTSGIAGPGGGTTDKPVGTVWIGLATKEKTISKKFQFKQNRERNIELSISHALNMLRIELLNLTID